MASFNIENPLQQLEQSGLAGVTLNDNAAPAANVIYSSLKSGGGGFTPPATTTSLGTIQLAGVLTGIATSPQLSAGIGRSFSLLQVPLTLLVLHPVPLQGSSLLQELLLQHNSHLDRLGSSQIANGACWFFPNWPTVLSVLRKSANGAVGASQIANGAIGPMQLASLSGPSGVARYKQYKSQCYWI